ncbi:AbrB/MazE/SpoVT family DNA-binding domain-containing protein [candidate division KSB1 bacterium]|nr:AbrB/MazE/SpoVT family DNA-binding domain-containing protein [candidate division KSB1 bacterium]
MPHVKIGPKHQITIPKEVFETLQLETGDILEVTVQDGKGIIIPKRILEKMPLPKLSPRDQKLLKSAKRKIQAIRKDLKSANGLTEAETEVAAKVGLIDPEQRWWWTEEWQQGEREAQRDIDQGRIKEFHNPEELLNSLRP